MENSTDKIVDSSESPLRAEQVDVITRRDYFAEMLQEVLDEFPGTVREVPTLQDAQDIRISHKDAPCPMNGSGRFVRNDKASMKRLARDFSKGPRR